MLILINVLFLDRLIFDTLLVLSDGLSSHRLVIRSYLFVVTRVFTVCIVLFVIFVIYS